VKTVLVYMMVGAILGTVGMLVYAFANYENTAFGSTLVWAPFIALEGAIGGYIAGGVLGFICFLIDRVFKAHAG